MRATTYERDLCMRDPCLLYIRFYYIAYTWLPDNIPKTVDSYLDSERFIDEFDSNYLIGYETRVINSEFTAEKSHIVI